ncbi:PREDICTED: uncharacterized protein LOC108775676 [Cyphomyrmex costatus]|uniref:uncharacterized protein LOC108775676 n=1 Tax=Cyphomyrmex costatus TaxID=456900 RepID=UPI0008522962|nr:PREDICTED: uncharacterized protein LOC108775676 [Cyphomyrmex costatus]
MSVKRQHEMVPLAFDVRALLSLCLQLVDRLPQNIKHFQQLQMLSPKICLNQIRPKFQELPFLNEFINENDLGILEMQWNKLLNINWVEIIGDNIINDCYTFWPKVYKFKNAGGNFVFKELATYVLTLLSLPTSNAVVERVFSIMNAVKTKTRNRILIKILDSIIRIRINLYAHGICCNNFVVTKSMLADFNSKTIYPNTPKTANDINVEEVEIEISNMLQEFDLPCISLYE